MAGKYTHTLKRHIVILVAVAAIVVGGGSTPVTAQTALTRTLAPGSSGSEVSTLQAALAQDRVLYPEGLVTGYYGELTKRAVERFQIRYGIAFSGTPNTTGFGAVGEETRRKFNEVYARVSVDVSITPTEPAAVTANTPTVSVQAGALTIGSTGPAVAELQQNLATEPSIYPEGLVTGYFGPLTQAAVRRFQERYGIVSGGTPETTGYGLVGPRTRAMLESVFASGVQTATPAAATPTVTPTASAPLLPLPLPSVNPEGANLPVVVPVAAPAAVPAPASTLDSEEELPTEEEILRDLELYGDGEGIPTDF